MPLYFIDGTEAKSTPYPQTFALLDRLSPGERQAAVDAIEELIDGTEVQTSSWMPGADWTDTPFQPIYEKAAKRNHGLAAKIFGLMVFDVFRSQEDDWYTGRFELNGEPLSGLTYFRSMR